jgi:CRISPR-associated endoribonuclease Cas6
MRIKIKFYADGLISLPLHYNYLIQSFIYRNIDEKLSQFLHEKGFIDKKRRFKGFTFSRLMAKERKIDSQKGKIILKPPFELVISSPINQFIQSFAEEIIRKESLQLGKSKVYFESINVYAHPEIGKELRVKMLSPVTTYSTLCKSDGRKKTYYYSPFESEFSNLVRENLHKKCRAYFGEECAGQFAIEPERVAKRDEKIILYKGTVIKAWMGVYRLSGTPELLKLAYDAGIGSKNSQGFGCFELLDKLR